ncbi:coiled-coil domain-containing protein 14 isoform X1 [Misgurnus anguillicaudatus]|uniref:coiled-coil domain-containing protein 14 isoform X1 n=1 Tax=Misgurnus anguillicaudatus TaxID=75329 RepID=UPI003CCEF9A5
MARQGISRPKVVSSGRLTGSGRGHIYKKRVTGRSLPPLEPAYSLYSTDSEDQVTTIHKGLDRCAALLNGILEAEQAESKPKSPGAKTTFKAKPKNLSRKTVTDKKHERKTGPHAKKKPVPVQKTILSASLNAGIRGVHDTGQATITKAKQTRPHPFPPAHSQPDNNKLAHLGGVQTSTVFNCRLTQSTPAFSPQRPGSAQSEPCVQNRNNPSEEFDHANPTQFSSSLPMPRAIQKQCPVIVQSSFQNGHCVPVEQGVPLTTAPICDDSQMGSVGSSVPLASSTGNLSCPSMEVPGTQVPVQAHVTQAQSSTIGQQPMISKNQERIFSMESSNESCGGTSAEEDNIHDVVDTMPVRDISKEKSTDLNYSPEKTTRKVMTVRYLLGELKTLVANQDSEAVRLISELEQSISLLPVMVGSTNIQAEIALALQPLRSENAQLRRRLRILNQQLLERERAERRARPADCNMEVVALQSLNLTLQTQLNESHRELQDLQQENMRLQKALESKENNWQQHKAQCETENSRLRLELNEALAEIQSCQSKLQKCEFEKTALTLSFQQREGEISRLQEIIRSLQPNQMISPKTSQLLDLPQSSSKLTRSVLEWHENAQKETGTSDKLTSSVKTYLQTLEGAGQASSPHRAHILQPASSCGGKETIIPSDGQICSPKLQNEIHKPILEAIAENVPQLAEQSITSFAPLRETSVGLHGTGMPHSKPFTQCKELMPAKSQKQNELQYMSGSFGKLDISDTLHSQESKYDSQNKGLNEHPLQSQHARRCLKMDVESGHTERPSVMESTFASCDIKSLASDWSVNSWSTFNTRDEQNFREGLAALDASIASLQRTLKADLNK